MLDALVVDLAIRDAELSDAPALAAFMCELGYETSRAEMEMRLRAILGQGRYKTLVAVMGGEICGMIGTVSDASYMHNDLNGRIIALVVSDKMRRRGVGRKLIAAAEEDFARRRIKRVTLTARFERNEAHRFYEMVGFARTGFRFAKSLEKPAG